MNTHPSFTFEIKVYDAPCFVVSLCHCFATITNSKVIIRNLLLPTFAAIPFAVINACKKLIMKSSIFYTFNCFSCLNHNIILFSISSTESHNQGYSIQSLKSSFQSGIMFTHLVKMKITLKITKNASPNS